MDASDNNSSAKHQIPEITVFRALCMLFVVIGHTPFRNGFNGPFDLFPVYSFHVSAFVFCAGYLYKQHNDTHPIKYILKKAKTLLLPLLSLNLAYGLLNTFLRQCCGFSWGSDITLYTLFIAPFVDGHQFNLSYALWFVPTLFFAESINVLARFLLKQFLERLPKATETALALIYLILGAAAVKMGGSAGLGPGIPLLLNRTLFFLSFLGIGRIWKLFVVDCIALNNLASLALLCSLKYMGTFLIGENYSYYPSWAIYSQGPFATYYVSIVGIAFYFGLSKALVPVLIENRLVKYLSNASFSVMAHHRLGFFALTCIMGIVARYTPFNNSFDFELFKQMPLSPHENDYWFVPHGMPQFYLVYTAFGLLVPYLIHKIWEAVKRHLATQTTLHK